MSRLFIFAFILSSCFFSSCNSDDDYSPTADTEKPTSPGNLVATNIEEISLRLHWTASTDNIGVSHYRIYQNGSLLLDNANETNAQISGLTPETAYEFHVTAVDAAGNESSPGNTLTVSTLSGDLSFLPLLSEMGVYSGPLANLNPAEGVQLYEINSTLYTDHASKQRLVRLPVGQKMRYDNSDLLPAFPDNSLVAKTFYYNIDDRNPALGKHIIETRILLKINGEWQVGNYVWNAEQTEAALRDAGSTENISYIDDDGNTQNIGYQIPSKQDCFTCHNNNGTPLVIGMKLRSMNFVPSYTSSNQLDYLTAHGFLEGVVSAEISVLPDWTDEENYTVSERARAYMDINCAHCHQPGGAAPPVYNLDLRLETPFEDSGIFDSRLGILDRFGSVVPDYRMPQLGRTTVHEEALAMLTEYIDSMD